jgi:hypothetical protein
MAALIEAMVRTAGLWRDPEHPPRARAIEATLACENRFTLEALAFAIDQQMSSVTVDSISNWLSGRRAAQAVEVGVLSAGNVPLAGFQDLLAVLLTGHSYFGVTSSKSPALLPAFVEDAGSTVGERARFGSFDDMLGRVSAVIATGSDETRDMVKQRASDAGIPPERMLLRGSRYSVAVIDGSETVDDLDGLAEDILLHEGLGCRNVAIVFADERQSPDALLEAMARFRGVFPAHERTPGALTMQRAMLAAVDAPHAYGDGLEFLVSKGEPDVQIPGHVRWTPYGEIGEACSWIDRHESELQVLASSSTVGRRIQSILPDLASLELVGLGEAQRPPLSWRPDGHDTIAFLSAL